MSSQLQVWQEDSIYFLELIVIPSFGKGYESISIKASNMAISLASRPENIFFVVSSTIKKSLSSSLMKVAQKTNYEKRTY
jgi:hypothetical protein